MINPTVQAVGGVRPGPKKVEFVKSVFTAPRRLVMSIDGEPKTGKTHFCLTAPGPICVHNIDLGLDDLLEQYALDYPEKDLYEFRYEIPISARLPGAGFSALAEPAAKVWEDFVHKFRASVTDMRTTVVDTGSEAWNLCRLARLGKLTQVLPIQYTSVNAEFRQLTQLALTNTESNVIYTHRVKPVYKNEQKTEEKERQGFGEIDYDVQCIVRTHRDLSKSGIEQFSLTIEECRANLAATGMRFVGADCTFSKVAQAVYPKTDEAYWRK